MRKYTAHENYKKIINIVFKEKKVSFSDYCVLRSSTPSS